MEENMNGEKFNISDSEYIRIDGVWFKYEYDKYDVIKEYAELENLYKEKQI